MKTILSDEILEEFIEMMENVRDKQFEIGDRLIELVETHGDKSGVINHIAGRLNISASVLYDYYRIAERWKPIYRQMYQSLDWTIYRNADPIEDKELLERCMDEGWNASRFKEEKYPALKEPPAIIQRITTIVQRYAENDLVWQKHKSYVETILDDLVQVLWLIDDERKEIKNENH